MRNPIAIEPDQFGDAFEKERLRNFWHGEACGRAIHASEIVAGAEQRDAGVRGAMRLEAFEDGLTVVERSECRRKRDRAEGNDLRLLPRSSLPIGDEHMVAEGGAEFGIFAQRFREPGLWNASNRDRVWHRASQGEKRTGGPRPAPTETDKMETREDRKPQNRNVENSRYFAALALTPLYASVRRDL